jgi:exopolyphosphatase/guanosine-5'-triphosphate,3'-diphosphate pyrophosphatase
LKLAAIDIGSNAVRLLISEVVQNEQTKNNPQFNKLNFLRVPIRLGFDVFEKKYISKEKIDMLVQTLKAFRHLINAYEVKHIKVCATSAMRDAENSKKVIEIIKKETGLEIKVISGKVEAKLIYENHIAEKLDNKSKYIYVDVGGGSTEISFFDNGRLAYNNSFNIGTIRLLKGRIHEKDWQHFKEAIKKATKNNDDIAAIGSGGNINKVFSLSKKKEGKSLPIDLLHKYLNELKSLTVEERIRHYNLKLDRADVIVPALEIYLNVMLWAGCEKIFVPKIGLADGLIHHLWEELSN